MSKNWEITLEIIFPLDTNMKFDSPPEKLEFLRKFVEESEIKLDGVDISLKKWSTKKEEKFTSPQGSFVESAMLFCKTSGDELGDAIEKAMPHIEWACDQLAFFSQHPILISSSQVRCLENPDEFHAFSKPYQPAKFLRTINLNTRTSKKIPLIPTPINFGDRERAIMRWYHKSLSAHYDIDRFLFLWISLELLCKREGTKVKSTYKNQKCGHEISKCPHCNESTEKVVNGDTLKKYLAEHLNVSKTDAAQLWKFRQFVHGQNELTSADSQNMGRLTALLHSAVNAAVKQIFGLTENDPPYVTQGGPSITAMSLVIQAQ